MPNVLFTLGSLDLSAFVRVNPDDKFDPAQGDHLEPSFSDSPFFEGQYFTSLHAKNKEMHIPLFLHPSQAPYLQDELNTLVQNVNAALRPVTDLGQGLNAQWQNARADFPTFFTVQFGRFEPAFVFRQTEKGWLAGELHLWVLPYGHTATERVVGTYSAPANQSGGVFSLGPGFSALMQTQAPVPYGWWRFNDPGPTVIDAGSGVHMGSYFTPASLGQPGAMSGDPADSLWMASGGVQIQTIHNGHFGYGVWFMIPTAQALGANAVAVSNLDNSHHGLVGYFQGGGLQSMSAEWGDGASTHAGFGGLPAAINDGKWHLAVWSYGGSALAMYFDGQSIAQLAVPTAIQVPGGVTPLYWGAAPNVGGIAPWAGFMQDAFFIAQELGSGNVASMWAAGPMGAIGDVSPQFDIRVKTGSYTGVDGQVGIISALPIPSYNPIVPVGSFIGLSPSAIIYGASGAWASQFLAMDAQGGSQGAVKAATYNSQGYFSFALSPASVYAGDNRVLGLVRARAVPFGLRAFDSVGNPLGPTAIASAMDGWQLVDYGILNVPPWMSTIAVNIQAYPGLPYTASGMFSPPRAAPAWSKEHGPIFVVPNAYSLMELDWSSPVLTMDGFDGASGAALGQDMLGNAWQYNLGATMTYSGLSQVIFSGPAGDIVVAGSQIAGDVTIEGVFTFPTASISSAEVGQYCVTPGGVVSYRVGMRASPSGAYFAAGNASVAIPSFVAGQYHIRMVIKSGVSLTGYLSGPSGAFSGAASGAPLIGSQSFVGVVPTSGNFAGFGFGIIAGNQGTVMIESFRARALASTGHQALDTFHLSQPYNQNTRMLTASGPDVVDLQARQRGPLGAISLPAPSLGAGLFVASFNWDQGPANDILSVDVRMRERFTYAR